MSEYQLFQRITELSNATGWEYAIKEWILHSVWKSDIPETCLCGHSPILELCQLENKINHNTVIVGNCCVKKFIPDMKSDLILQGVKRAQDGGALNKSTIEHAYNSGWINDWERRFYLDTWRKSNLSEKQQIKRDDINHKVLSRMKER